MANSMNQFIEFDANGKQVFHCRFGHIHDGGYAQEDMMRCNCPHPAALYMDGEDSASCVECGQEIEIIPYPFRY
jgi:hypothetical protein